MDDEISPSAVTAPPSEDTRIVDIRSPAAFDRGHIPGSENIPMDRLPDCVESLADADRIVTVCPHGKASVQAARLIDSYEHTDARVVSLEGGLEAWDGPLEAEAPESTERNEDAPF